MGLRDRLRPAGPSTAQLAYDVLHAHADEDMAHGRGAAGHALRWRARWLAVWAGLAQLPAWAGGSRDDG